MKIKMIVTKTKLFVSLFLLLISTRYASGQTSKIGVIDFYGSVSNEKELRKCLPFIEKEVVKFLNEADAPKAKTEIIDCLLKQPGIKQANVNFVCCYGKENEWMVYVGVESKSKDKELDTKTNDIKLTPEIKVLYDSLMKQLFIAVQKGEASEDRSSGHSLFGYSPARKLQEEFIPYANNNLSLLQDVLKTSRYIEQREVAATVIAYYHDKSVIVNDLLDAVSDSDEDVRNNAVRAIGIIADYSESHPELKIEIPATQFINMINSISWTDRNKSSFVLESLTRNRDEQLLKQLKQQALKPITDMAKWKSEGHAMLAFMMLGRIAGWSDQEIFDGMNNDRAGSIEKMLIKINQK